MNCLKSMKIFGTGFTTVMIRGTITILQNSQKIHLAADELESTAFQIELSDLQIPFFKFTSVHIFIFNPMATVFRKYAIYLLSETKARTILKFKWKVPVSPENETTWPLASLGPNPAQIRPHRKAKRILRAHTYIRQCEPSRPTYTVHPYVFMLILKICRVDYILIPFAWHLLVLRLSALFQFSLIHLTHKWKDTGHW